MHRITNEKIDFEAQWAKEKLKEYTKVFQEFDKNNDGVISADELRTALLYLGDNPTEDQVLDMIMLHDVDKSGALDFSEFVSCMISYESNQQQCKQELTEAFDVFDPHGCGLIHVDNLREICAGMFGKKGNKSNHLEQVLNQIGVDSDGNVKYAQVIDVLLGI